MEPSFKKTPKPAGCQSVCGGDFVISPPLLMTRSGVGLWCYCEHPFPQGGSCPRSGQGLCLGIVRVPGV